MTSLCVAPMCGEKCIDCNCALSQKQVVRYATRYMYLRSRNLDQIKSGGVFAGMTPDNVVLNGDDLDAAIDNAVGLLSRVKSTSCGDVCDNDYTGPW